MIIFNHHTKVLNHRKFIFCSHCDTLLGSLAIVHERCKSSCFILPFSIDWSRNLRVFVPWNACLLIYISCFGQDINRLPCFYCFFIVLFRIISLIIQLKNLWPGHCLSTILISPRLDSRDVMMAKLIVRAIPIGSIAKSPPPPPPPGRDTL